MLESFAKSPTCIWNVRLTVFAHRPTIVPICSESYTDYASVFSGSGVSMDTFTLGMYFLDRCECE